MLFAAALAVRLVAIFALDTPGAAEGKTPWKFGGESACLAASLAEGRGYGDPWAKDTGPSSWLTPVYPAFLAGLMELGGGVTRATALFLFLAQSLASAATCVLLAVLGARLGLSRAGVLAGWLLACYPIAVWNAVQTVWDTTFVAFALTAFLALLCVAGGSLRAALAAGLAYGALLFLNPAPLAVLPAALAFLAWRAGSAKRALLLSGAFLAVAALVCLPWCLRNQRVLGTFALRPNFGVEMRMGNHDEANGRPVPFRYHPSHVEAELALYRELGEAEYGRDNQRRALEWIREHPSRFAALSLRRMRIFWIGELPTSDPRRSDELAPGRDWNSWLKYAVYALSGALALIAPFAVKLDGSRRLLVGGVLLLFGIPYFLTHVSERYRFPIDPLILLVDAALLLELLRRGPVARRAP